jgi:DNA-binding NarL/FixJ family response regulator
MELDNFGAMELEVAVIDDHLLIADLFSMAMREYGFIKRVTTYASGKEFLKSVENGFCPDVLLLDMLMPDMNGQVLLELIRSRQYPIKVIILSTVSDLQSVRAAFRAGADGYLDKGIQITDLVNALQQVYSGEQYVSHRVSKMLIRNMNTGEPVSYNLSPQQKEVLRLVCMGRTIKEIAHEMQLSTNTVQTYYRNVMKKFGVNRMVDLVSLAIRNGFYQEQR